MKPIGEVSEMCVGGCCSELAPDDPARATCDCGCNRKLGMVFVSEEMAAVCSNVMSMLYTTAKVVDDKELIQAMELVQARLQVVSNAAWALKHPEASA